MGAFGEKLGEFVGVKSPPTIEAQSLQTGLFAATHLSWDDRGSEVAARIGLEDAFLIFLQRRNIPANPYWIDGKPVDMKPLKRGQFLLLDLNQEHRSVVRSAVDCLAFYVPSFSLKRIADEQQMGRLGTLRPSHGDPFEDPVIWHLGECLLPALLHPEQSNQLFTDYVSLAMITHLATKYGDAPQGYVSRHGMLCPWQERRAKELLMAHLDGNTSLEELARACRLSRSHFARAFKATTGLPPHRWLLARRLERAFELLLAPDLSLDSIAVRCGFADHSHLHRVFVKAVGTSPGQWRQSICL
jgi:AraC-like DNA-binding protein